MLESVTDGNRIASRQRDQALLLKACLAGSRVLPTNSHAAAIKASVTPTKRRPSSRTARLRNEPLPVRLAHPAISYSESA